MNYRNIKTTVSTKSCCTAWRGLARGHYR